MLDKSTLLHHIREHDPLTLVLVGLVCAVWVFLPTLIAGLRRHRAFRLIALINLVFFWEFWIWVPLMAWACLDRPGDALTARFEQFTQKLTGFLTRKRKER